MKFLRNTFIYQNNSQVIGLTEELNIFYILNKYNDIKDNVLVVASSLYQANIFYEKISNYSDNVLLFPMDDFITSVAVAISPELKLKRLETLNKINESSHNIIVTNLMGYLRYLPNVNEVNKLSLYLNINKIINRDELINILEEYGYNQESLVLSTGTYAVRGFVVDIFIVDEEHPIRIEFFGDEIESIRYFDESTQLSIKNIEEIEILPNIEIDTNIKSSIVDYLKEPQIFYLDEKIINDEYKKIQEDIKSYQKEKEEKTKYMFDLNEISENKIIYLNHLENINHKVIRYNSSSITNFNSNFDLLKSFIEKKIKDKTIIFYLSKTKEIDEITKIYPLVNIVDEERNIKKNRVNIVKKNIINGFEIGNYVVISEYDIELNKKNQIKYKNNLRIGTKLKSFDDLQIGDYVVHYKHGIGIYGGIVSLNKSDVIKDYILINYLGNDKVYVPVEKIDTIFKYTSKDGNPPRINKLNSLSWEKTKLSLKKRIHNISKELLKLYALRTSIKGPQFKYNELEDIFASEFEYILTPDQVKAIEDINNDLLNQVPMDRLLCGDVGFGKTEVAFRAMIRTILNDKQVAYLCPTTILSRQQYQNAIDRFKSIPIRIEILNRFTSPKKTKEIVEGLEKGTVDIVIGTHRLLSDDIKFNKLGLLIVDEEQRFGVTHKEKIKQLKNDVNVLTLSATPIPRTLKMALTGLRDLSIIDTPPVNRYPVQTYVLEEQDVVIKDAIYKEMTRHGQIFILYNRIDSIEQVVRKISELVPEARIAYAHGRMNKSELEDVMQDFIDYNFDVLICTTIIETGIDMPNVNTLIIYDADNYGLSQLYQLRGRVGRSNKVAYAYLMYNKNKMLNDIAIKRLDAIKEFTELGSGYRIAMRDLSLRGAGDILGDEQSGFVSEVGLDLYMKLVDEEIRRLKGEEIADDIEDIKDNSLIDVNTHIDNNYVYDESLKIEIHKKINEINSYKKLIEIKQELEDRFGKISQELEIYMYEEWFEKLALKLGIDQVEQNRLWVEIKLKPEIVEKIKFDKLFIESYDICNKFQFKTFHKYVVIHLNISNLEKHFIYYIVEIINLISNELDKNNDK